MSVLGMLNKTCSIVAKTASKSSITGSIMFTESTTTGVPCAVQVKQAGQMDAPFQAGETVYNFYFGPGQAVSVASKITTVTDYTNYEFQVVSDPQDDVGRGAYTRVKCRHVTGGAIV